MKNSRTKKFLALVLVLMMALALGVPTATANGPKPGVKPITIKDTQQPGAWSVRKDVDNSRIITNPLEKTDPQYTYQRVEAVENGGVYIIVVNKNNTGYYAVSNVDREVNKGLILQEATLSSDETTFISTIDSNVSMDSILWSFDSAAAGGYTIRSLADDEYIIVSNSFLSTGTTTGYCWDYQPYQDSCNVLYNSNTGYYMAVRGAGVGFMDVSFWPDVNHNYMLFKRVALENVPVSSITLNPTSLNMIVGESKRINAVVLPVDATDRSVAWTTSDADVATVDGGNVTAHSVGTATITATTTDGGLTATCSINVTELDLEGTVIGYKLYEPNNPGSGFISFDLSDPSEYTTITTDADSRYLAGEFYNGVVYMVTSNGEIACVNPADWSSITISTPLNYGICDLAYDYTTNTMYAYGANNLGDYLLSIDLLTGRATQEAQISGVYGTVAMACSADGQLYVVNTDGDLCTLDKTTGNVQVVGNTGRVDIYPYYQCMFFDHNTGNLYWMQEGRVGGGMLNFIDIETGEATFIGTVGAGAELAGGFIYYYPNGVPSQIDVEGVCVYPSALNLETGSVRQLTASVLPVNATNSQLIYTSTDPSVATVTDDGLITAVSAGITSIIVTSADANFSDVCDVTVSDPLPPATIYGYRYYLNSQMSGGTVDLSWVSFSSDNPGLMQTVQTNNWDTEAAEYYDGNIYGYDSDGDFFYIAMDENWRYYYPENRVAITGMLDMAYDYSTDTMFAVREDNRLYYVSDMSRGEQTLIGQLNMRVYAMCCTTDGRLYGIAANGYLYKIDKQTAQMEVVGSTGVDSVYFRQSMAYDHNTGKAYWSAFNLNIEGHLREVDLATGESLDLGVLQYNADLTGMFIPYTPQSTPTAPTTTAAPTVVPTTSAPTTVPPTTVSPTTVPPTIAPPPADGRLYAYSPETLPDNEGTYAWLSIDPNDVSDIVYEEYPPYIFYSATFYNGALYAYDEYGFLFEYDMNTWEGMPTGGYCTPYLVFDMDVDPVTGVVYALVYSDGMAYDTSQFADEGYYIATADMSTGFLTELYMVGPDFMPTGIAALGNGNMLSVDVNTNRVVEFDAQGNYTLRASVGFTLEYSLQSMTYCEQNGLVYWGAVDSSHNSSLRVIDPQNYAVTNLGSVPERLTSLFFVSETPTLFGDVNGDNIVNTGDAAAILRYVVGLLSLDEQQLLIADINGDGVVNTGDAAALLSYIMQ